jgi:hypothetical protein
VLNGAFVSKIANSTVISQVTLNRAGSGPQVTDTQAKINDNSDRITVNESNITTLQSDVATAQSDITALQLATPQSLFSATVDPTSGDDALDGYAVGSRWINITNNRSFVAVDVTPGAAIWKRTDKERFAVSFFTTLDMSVSNITDAAYVELVADTGAEEIRKINAFYPAGSILIFAIGPAASEVDDFILQPGGGSEEVVIPPNSRVSLKLVSGQAPVTSGVLAVNFLTEV